MTKVTGWDNGLCQDYDKGLGRWFANRLGARQQLRQDFKMTQVLIDRATLEQLVAALNNAEDALNNSQALIAGRERFGFAKPCYGANEIALGFVSLAITEGRAALANAETAGWRTLVDQGKEAHELAKIMKDFADKNPESLMLKELK